LSDVSSQPERNASALGAQRHGLDLTERLERRQAVEIRYCKRYHFELLLARSA
jgi:hypothetical protein